MAAKKLKKWNKGATGPSADKRSLRTCDQQSIILLIDSERASAKPMQSDLMGPCSCESHSLVGPLNGTRQIHRTKTICDAKKTQKSTTTTIHPLYLLLNSYVLLFTVSATLLGLSSAGLAGVSTSSSMARSANLANAAAANQTLVAVAESVMTLAASNTNSVIHNNGLDENQLRTEQQYEQEGAKVLNYGPLGLKHRRAEPDEDRSHDSSHDIDIDHQADNQSANQSNSSISRASAGVGGNSSGSRSEAIASADRSPPRPLSRSDTSHRSATPNPNKCNLSKFWRSELCASNSATISPASSRPQTRQVGNLAVVSEVGSDAKTREQASVELPVLNRVRRRAAGDSSIKEQRRVLQIPGASSSDNNADDEKRAIPIDPDQGSLMEAGGEELQEVEEAAEEFADIDPLLAPQQLLYGKTLRSTRPADADVSYNKQSNSFASSFVSNNNWRDSTLGYRRRRQLGGARTGGAFAGQQQQQQRETAQNDQPVSNGGGNQIGVWHRNLIELEDDDLFLEEGPPRVFASEEKGKPFHGLKSEPRVKRTSSGVQTIYFGGFFPWLTDDEQTTNRGLQRSAAAPATEISQTSSSVSMINANQERQHNDRKQESKEQQQRNNTGRDSVRRRKQRKQQEEYRSNQLDLNNNRNLQQQQQPRQQQQQYENVTLPFTSSVTAFSSSYSSEGRHQLGKFILPAVRLALDHINTNSSVLHSYKLEIVPRDTQCNATISLKEFFDMVYEEPKKMLLYGDACRVSTDPIAKASYFFDLIQISYADTDPIYTIENYPNFFRVVPSENALSSARIPFIRHFNWTRVGTIYQNLPRYSLPHSKLLTDLERFNIVIKQSVSLPGSVDALQNRDLGDELRKLKEKDVRIILGNFDEEWGLLLFCEAFREKMTGRKYQWILTGMSEDKLWQYYKAKGSSCTEQELLIAMDGYIVTDITPVTRSQYPTISGMMAHEYSNEYKRRALEMNISIEENKFYGYVYDGIWAIALALHRVDQQLKYYSQLAESGKVRLKTELVGLNSLLDFDYHKPIWVKLIRSALSKTKFDGVTGTVSFQKNQRPGLISFSQFQAFRDMSEVIIGSYDALNDNLDLNVGFPIFWRGPSPPIDYTIERVTPFRINRTLFVIISILALFGIALAIIFLTINIKFRDQRYIKMSSPYLNNLIIIGCILTYTSVIILGLDSGLTSEYNFPYICNARAWVLMAGFTLAFGSMFSKTFRVHSIFTNIKLHKKVIKDYKLFMVVFILLTFDVCILIVWQYFDPFYRDTNNGTSIQDSDNEDVIIVPEMEHCQSKRMTIFLSVIYVYKGLLMAFGCFLAWETRHVSIPALNDSKYIGLSVYNVVIMCVIGAGLSFVLRDQQDASFVIISIFIIFCSTTTLCLVFVPKLIELKQNPRAGDHRVRATLKTFKKNYHEEAMVAAGCRDIHGNLIGRGYGANLNERIKVLLEENVKQRALLKEKTYELEALTYKYRKIQEMVQSGQYHQAVDSTLVAGNSSNLAAQIAPSSSGLNSSALPTTVMLTNQEKDSYAISKDDRLNLAHEDKLSMIKSPLMSSTTQITTTNTTNSTNNTTDLTTDYSSTKLTSTATTTTSNGCLDNQQAGRRTLVAFDRPPSGKKIAFEKPADLYGASDNSAQNPRGYSQRLIKANQEAGHIMSAVGTTNSQVAHECQTKQQQASAAKCAIDSSYCSMGAADYELVDASGATTRSKSSQDDLNLFTVFSYISNNNRLESNANRSRRKRQARAEIAENNFGRWSEGPFCTLMVRNNDQRSITRNLESINQGGKGGAGGAILAPGEAILKNSAAAAISADPTRAHFRRAEMGTATGRQAAEETRASCPDLAATKYETGRPAVIEHRQIRYVRSPRRQSSQPSAVKPRASMKGSSRDGPLPRTISMIEYLGLGEFDLIARRHDKLLKRSRLNNKKGPPPPCCYELSSCPCCGQLPVSGDSRGHSRHASAYHTRCPAQSDGDLALSSSEPLNSGDLVQTSSRLSCSTCCSLASQSYVSQSDLYDETTRSSRTVSSETVTSASVSESSAQNKYFSNSQMSSRSGSILEQEPQLSTRYCQHGTQIFGGQPRNPPHHHHHHHHQHHQLAHHLAHHSREPLSSTSSASSSSSSPFIVNNNHNATNDLLQTNENSLCTSGTLYCSPAAKEDANGAAQIVNPQEGATISGDSNSILIDKSNAESGDQQEENFPSIKCDLLESL